MEVVSRSSRSGCHVLPALVLFHTPPATAPKYHVAESPGTPLTATTRPPLKGPICRHLMPPNKSGLTWAASGAANIAIARIHSTPTSPEILACLIGPRLYDFRFV